MIFIRLIAYPLLLISFGAFMNPVFSEPLPKICTSECIKAFGSVLGKNSGVIAYSNCNTDCISQQASTAIDNIFTGMAWQCVEYARRWLIQVQHVTFGDVDNAQQIWDINDLTGVNDNKKYTFISKPNSNSQAPEVGDLIIYKIALPDFPYGHVAVVVGVNLKEGYVDIAEQNYTNDQWMDPNRFARRIIMTHHQNKYSLIDKDYGHDSKISIDGVIIGWKHPLI